MRQKQVTTRVRCIRTTSEEWGSAPRSVVSRHTRCAHTPAPALPMSDGECRRDAAVCVVHLRCKLLGRSWCQSWKCPFCVGVVSPESCFRLTDQMTKQHFMTRVRILKSGCWLWLGCINRSGYGSLKDRKRTWLAHRWSYEYIAKRPHAEELHHVCRTRNCVNPKHLKPATKISHPDKPSALNRNKTHCANGHPYQGENLYVDKVGNRHCRACRRESAIQSYYRHHKQVRAKQAEHYRLHGRADRR